LYACAYFEANKYDDDDDDGNALAYPVVPGQKSLPLYEVYSLQVFAFKIVHDDACHPILCIVNIIRKGQ